MAQDLVSGHDQSFVLQKIFQKLKFLSGQLLHLALIADFVTGHIDTKALAVQLPLLALPCAAPKDRFDPGYKFHHPEGLGDIIICAALQTFYLVKLRFFGCDHDHRDIPGPGITFQSFQNIIPVFTREHDVQQDQLRQIFFHGCVKFRPGFKTFCLKACCLQGIDKKLSDISLIFHTVDHSISSLFIFLPLALHNRLIFFVPCLQYNCFLFTAQALAVC